MADDIENGQTYVEVEDTLVGRETERNGMRNLSSTDYCH